MSAEKLRQLKPDELKARIRELHDQLFNSKVKHATGQLEKTSLLRQTRRDLAAALTVQREQRQVE